MKPIWGFAAGFTELLPAARQRRFGQPGADFVPAISRNFLAFCDRNHRFHAGLVVQPTALGKHRLRPTRKQEVLDMLGWVVTFLIVALIAGILGFGGVAGASVEIAKIIFFIAVVLFVLSAVVGLARGRTRV
jgi:uncharacterized membrane protein YtjA (UPF0391 family)